MKPLEEILITGRNVSISVTVSALRCTRSKRLFYVMFASEGNLSDVTTNC